mmetsp:Transcript_57244/g.131405  ORF Transcript_57244/g.131405 Transcript_57244/m.131405 type:complete len:261 (-) Transcript_57244:3-785(-)
MPRCRSAALARHAAHQADLDGSRVQHARLRAARGGGRGRGAARRRARAARRVPVGAAHADRRGGAGRRLPRRFGAQDVRSDRHRLPLGPARAAERDATVDGRRRDDRRRLPRPLDVHAAARALRGGHAADHAGRRARRRCRLPHRRRHARGGSLRAAPRRVPLRAARAGAGPAAVRARPEPRHPARCAVRFQFGDGARVRSGHLPRPGWDRRARGPPLHAAAPPRARRRRLGARVAVHLQHRARRGRAHRFAHRHTLPLR